MINKPTLPANIGLGFMTGFLAGIFIFVLMAWMLWQIPLPFEQHNFSLNLEAWSFMTINGWISTVFQQERRFSVKMSCVLNFYNRRPWGGKK